MDLSEKSEANSLKKKIKITWILLLFPSLLHMARHGLTLTSTKHEGTETNPKKIWNINNLQMVDSLNRRLGLSQGSQVSAAVSQRHPFSKLKELR